MRCAPDGTLIRKTGVVGVMGVMGVMGVVGVMGVMGVVGVMGVMGVMDQGGGVRAGDPIRIALPRGSHRTLERV